MNKILQRSIVPMIVVAPFVGYFALRGRVSTDARDAAPMALDAGSIPTPPIIPDHGPVMGARGPSIDAGRLDMREFEERRIHIRRRHMAQACAWCLANCTEQPCARYNWPVCHICNPDGGL
jgi:hypothetical protein